MQRVRHCFPWIGLAAAVTLTACQPASNTSQMKPSETENTESEQAASAPANALAQGKPVVYQVFTRLFGNTNTTNKAWGTAEENGVGKFSDFTPEALNGIKQLGVSHIWYTGVPHHAVINDYSAYGISADDPDVVKGRAGSPYAVKDYYNVNPDLADDPAQRLQEFEALIQRTHDHSMKVIIDIVPNHVARKYESLSLPEGEANFGANDDTSVEYAKNNNFYYIVDSAFAVPQSKNGYQPLGGEAHPLSDGEFAENPAKWTGNGSRLAQPDSNDWYETVKVNYGVRPDGSYDFPELSEDFAEKDHAAHAQFWSDKDVPDSWKKFHSIVHYWLDKGVDGFRYDMAEMVPVEFWSYLNSSIKVKNPDAFLLAEVYQPHLYRDYLHLGKMDYLYDKVEFYDTLKPVMQGKGNTAELHNIISRLSDIDEHMLHFLENHDEQRIASPDFAGDAMIGKPALVASALSNSAPIMLYFGQDVGEDGSEDMGFGDPTRTSIFDYAGVPAHQRWMNDGRFDGGQLSDDEKALRQYYIEVMQIAANHPGVGGEYQAIETAKDIYAFVRKHENGSLLVVSNFNQTQTQTLDISAVLNSGSNNQILLSDATEIADGKVTLPPLGSVVWSF